MTNPRTGKPYTEVELRLLRLKHPQSSREYRTITQALWRMKNPSKAAENHRRTVEHRRERKAQLQLRYQPE